MGLWVEAETKRPEAVGDGQERKGISVLRPAGRFIREWLLKLLGRRT
jgi:hypothetical protein